MPLQLFKKYIFVFPLSSSPGGYFVFKSVHSSNKIQILNTNGNDYGYLVGYIGNLNNYYRRHWMVG